MILIDRQTFTLTPVTGSVEQLVITNNTLIQQILVKPATATTTFDFSIEDEDDNAIYELSDNQERLNDTDVNIASGGNWTIKIDSASVDEAFTVVLTLRRS